MKIPKFKNESEEADWWHANRKKIDHEFRNLKPVTDASGKLMTPSEIIAAQLAARKQPQFEHAPTDGIEKYRAIVDDFMRQIFEMEPEEYLITDESMMTDFLDFGEDRAMPQTRKKIQSIYGDVVEKNTDYLIEIFRRIAERNNS